MVPPVVPPVVVVAPAMAPVVRGPMPVPRVLELEVGEGKDGDGHAGDDQLHDALDLVIRDESEARAEGAEHAGEESPGLEGEARVGTVEERG